MCGIIGCVGLSKDPDATVDLLTALMIETQSRGHHATGYYISDRNHKTYFSKLGIPAKVFVQMPQWDLLKEISPIAFIGHTRFKTLGHQRNYNNNHPFVSPSENIGLIHNGSLKRFREFQNLYELHGDCDSELLLEIILHANNIKKGAQEIFEHFGKTGDFACEVIYRNPKTNITKFYIFRDPGRPARFIDAREILGQYFFTSTTQIWNDALKRSNLWLKLKHLPVQHIPAYEIWTVNANTLKLEISPAPKPTRRRKPKPIQQTPSEIETRPFQSTPTRRSWIDLKNPLLFPDGLLTSFPPHRKTKNQSKRIPGVEFWYHMSVDRDSMIHPECNEIHFEN